MTMDYGDPVSEHNNVRKNVGIIDLSFITKINLTGKDNLLYLHNRLSNSIETLKLGQGCYATLLDFKGRMLSDMWVHHINDFVLVTTSHLLRNELVTNLQKFIFAEQVVVEDITEQLGTISVHGSKSKELINRLVNTPIGDLKIRDSLVRDISNQQIFIIRTEWTGEIGYHLFCPMEFKDNLWHLLLDKGNDLNVKPFGQKAFDSLRLENGKPIWGRDINNDNIPLEAGLQHAISFTKGCYPGQEIIAKITNLSHPWRLLVGLELQYDSPVNDKCPIMINSEEIGHVTSSTFSPTLNKIIALGYVKWENKEPDTSVAINNNGTLITAIIRPLPFYSRL